MGLKERLKKKLAERRKERAELKKIEAEQKKKLKKIEAEEKKKYQEWRIKEKYRQRRKAIKDGKKGIGLGGAFQQIAKNVMANVGSLEQEAGKQQKSHEDLIEALTGKKVRPKKK